MSRKLARGAMALAVVGAGAFTGLSAKRVHLVVDGREREVVTLSRTVGSLLSSEGVQVTADDLVEPPHTEPLRDGSRVAVYHARPYLVLFRKSALVVSLPGPDPGAVLAARLGRKLRVRPSRSGGWRDGLSWALPAAGEALRVLPPSPSAPEVLEATEAVEVTLEHDGRVEVVETLATTVAGLLAEAGLTLGPVDRAEPSPESPVEAGMRVRVVRVRVEEREEPYPIPPPKTRVEDGNLDWGIVRRDSGAPGTGVRVWRLVFEDGTLVSRTLLADRVVTPPRPEVTRVGRKMPKCACGRGFQVGRATWYGVRGMTAAHRTLPFGTVVRVTNLNTGASVTVVINDRGPFGSAIIDLSRDAFARLAPLSQGVIPVRVEW